MFQREDYINKLCDFLTQNSSEEEYINYYKQDYINYIDCLSQPGYYKLIGDLMINFPEYEEDMKQDCSAQGVAKILYKIDEVHNNINHKDYFLNDHIEMLNNTSNQNIGKFYEKNKHKLSENQINELNKLMY